MTTTDPRHADLYISAATFLHRHALHPDPATYLAHGYVDLCLAAWPGARGVEFDLATRWALWTWLTDDLFDVELRDSSPGTVSRTVLDLLAVAGGTDRPGPGAQPLLAALAELVRETAELMPDTWQRRHYEQFEEWLHAAAEKLLDYTQPGRPPTLRAYLTIRPADGAMLMAAMWTELALGCVTPDWSDPLVRSMLACFSACGTTVNDLADRTGTFTPAAALVNQGAAVPEARQRSAAWLRGEEYRWWMLCTAVRTGGYDRATVDLARGLDRFRAALTGWTARSARYAPSAPTGSPTSLPKR
ncbi:hypothetical protein GCM10009665_05380 [Kitasatospora nipponensis]|uniref:Terpene synthase n=1 Tax=Kitasatospora nipponensis TaxID=258049 RepID=A0ABN1VRP5_9ACTN